jgi:CubicO group peptidase (beta-lactamase class C family)
MRKTFLRVLAGLLVVGSVYLNVDYWRDPIYWRRWWDTVTHLQPDHFAFEPTEDVQGGAGLYVAGLKIGRRTIASDALRRAEEYASKFESFALIVVHHGVIQDEWYRPDWSRERLTQSQSMHKTVVALALGAAIQDGFVKSVNNPIGDYLAEWANDERGRIRIRDLLNMSSGLAQYAFTLNPFASDSAFRFLFSANRPAVVLRTALLWKPGSKFEYNDVNAQLVGMIVERATRRRYADYLAARIWVPSGAAPAKIWLDHPRGGAMTACCLLAPAVAWAQLGEMLKNRGVVNGTQVYPAAWIEQMLTPSQVYRGYGLFTWLGKGMMESPLPLASADLARSEPYLAPDLFMLLGHGGQRVYVSRAVDLVVVRLGPFAGYQPLKPGWDDAFLINTVIRGIGMD